jgi:hypothetical protein
VQIPAKTTGLTIASTILLEFGLEMIDILIPIAVLRSVMNPGVGKEREATRPFQSNVFC